MSIIIIYKFFFFLISQRRSREYTCTTTRASMATKSRFGDCARCISIQNGYNYDNYLLALLLLEGFD